MGQLAGIGVHTLFESFISAMALDPTKHGVTVSIFVHSDRSIVFSQWRYVLKQLSQKEYSYTDSCKYYVSYF